MIKSLSALRRRGRAWKRAGEFPILLPHFSIDEQGLVGPLGEEYPLKPELRRAVRLCDGTRPLADFDASSKLMELYDEGKLLLWRKPPAPRGPEEQVDTIILSPHPDDAALSVAHLLLASHGESVMVVDVFSQTAWWRFSESAGDLDEIQRVRFAEEQLMAQMANVKLRVLGLPEALLRGRNISDISTSEIDHRDHDGLVHLRRHCDALADLARVQPLLGSFVRHLGLRHHASLDCASCAAISRSRIKVWMRAISRL